MTYLAMIAIFVSHAQLWMSLICLVRKRTIGPKIHDQTNCQIVDGILPRHQSNEKGEKEASH